MTNSGLTWVSIVLFSDDIAHYVLPISILIKQTMKKETILYYTLVVV